MIEEIYIDRLGLFFENKEQLVDYIENYYNIFRKEELKEIILILLNNK